MLTLAKVQTAAAAPYAEYLISRMQGAEGRGDYYLNKHGRQEAPGRWALGDRGRAFLGVESDQPVSETQLRNLLAVRFPDDPERPLRRVGGNGQATAAIDATFSAPKSVSVVWALGSDDTRRAIEEAHERAIDVALEQARQQVPMLRRRVDKNTVIRERAGEVVASVFRHTTARAVDGQPPDPQLHSHVLLHGALRENSDGQTELAAIESRAWMVHQRELAACYRGELADRLRELGYRVERRTGRDGRYFEIRGVPRPVIDRFSSRRRQVRELIEWRKHERLHGLRELVELDGERGREARLRLDRAVADHNLAIERLKDQLAAGADEDTVRARLEQTEYELLERTEGLYRLAGRVDRHGDRARRKLEDIERHGDRLSPAQERAVAMESRAPKGLETHGDLDKHWYEAAVELGLDARDVAKLVALGPEAPAEREELLRELARALTMHRATFVDREARAAAFEVAGSRRDALGLLDELASRDELVALEDGRFTTQAQRSLERHAVRHAGRLAAGRLDPIPEVFVDAELAHLGRELERFGGLSPEQEQAVRAACSDRQLVVVQGQAGTGKSTALKAAARAEQIAGRRIVVTSTGGQAAERLASELRQAGVMAEGYSTRALEAQVEHGRLRLGPDTTVIHDECALASTREQNMLFWACHDSGARLVEVGDRDQNNPVGAGGLMDRVERLAADHGVFVRLEHIVRALDPEDRAMQRALRGGDTTEAVASLERRGRVILAATRSEAAQAAAELWERLRLEQDGALLLCETANDQVDELNAQLQAIRQDAGELGVEAAPVPGRPYSVHQADEVVVRAQFDHPGIGTVRNGEGGTVVAVEAGRALVDFGNERQAMLDAKGIEAADLRLAYAQHSNPAQGVTTGSAIDLFTSLSTRRGQYVALTRGRHAHYLVTSYEDLDVDQAAGRDAALTALAEQMRRDEPEIPSLDFAELPSRRRARDDALALVRRAVGTERASQVAERATAERAPGEETSVAKLVDRATELNGLLATFPRRDRHAAIAADDAQLLRNELAGQQQRLSASRVQLEQTSRLRRREREQLETRIAQQEAAVAHTEREIAAREAAAAPGRDADRWFDEHLDELAEYVEVEAELGERFCNDYDHVLRRMRINPPSDIVKQLGERPAGGLDRELWERQAVRIQLHHLARGRFPEHSDLGPDEWRTAPTELARTTPDRPEIPARHPAMPTADGDAIDLGP